MPSPPSWTCEKCRKPNTHIYVHVSIDGRRQELCAYCFEKEMWAQERESAQTADKPGQPRESA